MNLRALAESSALVSCVRGGLKGVCIEMVLKVDWVGLDICDV
jgi:hypothetical protein